MFDLYKGATRPPMILGVPTEAALWAFVGTAVLAMMFGLIAWILFPIIFIVMRIIAKRDDRAFRKLGLWFDTKFLCNRDVKKFWGATAYTPLKLKNNWQSWDSKELRDKKQITGLLPFKNKTKSKKHQK